ncbi:hypothetical protein [Morganella morganii]|uniref:hypothetical protein n=1 Tax=Morganella morganii TaxID=582 RepID=UPI001BD9B04F|nr:hypothetical protein [Morganella morganii]ELT0454608.1 hypothetical protein [Morganella morganii]MBT0337223.1 hypothetical protein [Morganella morganii subsp. morganii]
MSDKDALVFFGEKLIKSVRDQAVFEFEATLSGKIKSERAIRLYSEISGFDKHQIDILRKFVFTSIDNVIYNTLNMLEQNEDNMRLLISQDGDNEKNVVEISDGLSGELFTENGWIEKFSKYK